MFSDRISRIQPSATLAMTSKAAELKRNNKPVYNMSVGEPDFPTPLHIQQAGIDAIQQGHTRYTPGGGTFELKDAICQKLKRDNNLIFDINQVVVSCGGKHSLYNACQVLFQTGDEVIIFTPYWVSFPDFVTVTGAKPVFVDTNSKKQNEPDFDDLKKKITPNTKGIIINSPSNPTGGVWEEEALLKLLRIAKENEWVIISDECYERLVYDGEFISTEKLNREKNINATVVTCLSLSKTYAMTGWRIGYTAGPNEIIKAMSKLQGQATSCANSIGQMAGIEALTGNQNCVEEMKSAFKKRRDLMVGLLDGLPKVTCSMPGGAFYAFPDFSSFLNKEGDGKILKDTFDISEYILNSASVVTVPGDGFGAPGHIRFSYATSTSVIKKGIERVSSALSNII